MVATDLLDCFILNILMLDKYIIKIKQICINVEEDVKNRGRSLRFSAYPLVKDNAVKNNFDHFNCINSTIYSPKFEKYGV